MASRRQANRGGRNNSKQNWTVKPRPTSSSSAQSCQNQPDFNSLPNNQQNQGVNSESQLASNSVGVDAKQQASASAGNQRAVEGNSSSHSDEIDEDLIVKRLEELRFSAQEPELTEELLSINKQLQEDEVLLNFLHLFPSSHDFFSFSVVVANLSSNSFQPYL